MKLLIYRPSFSLYAPLFGRLGGGGGGGGGGAGVTITVSLFVEVKSERAIWPKNYQSPDLAYKVRPRAPRTTFPDHDRTRGKTVVPLPLRAIWVSLK